MFASRDIPFDYLIIHLRTALNMLDIVLNYVYFVIQPFVEAFQFLSFLVERSFEDLPSSYTARFNRVLYVVYEISVVSLFILLRWLIFTVYHMTVGFFSLMDLVYKSVNRQIRFFARRNYIAQAASVDSSHSRRRKRGKNHKR